MEGKILIEAVKEKEKIIKIDAEYDVVEVEDSEDVECVVEIDLAGDIREKINDLKSAFEDSADSIEVDQEKFWRELEKQVKVRFQKEKKVQQVFAAFISYIRDEDISLNSIKVE